MTDRLERLHAAAYALLAYQTAWLKTHYPHEFYAASMCFDMHQSEKLSVFVDDMRKNAIAVEGPDINRSVAEFTVEQTDEGHAVRYALAGIRNVGEKAMDAIVAEREAHGRFESLEDLFLGHAPKKMSDKHYTEVPGKLLDRGIAWLETLYKIPTSPQSED